MPPPTPVLSDMQQSMLAHESLTGRPIYNMPLCFRLAGQVDAELLDRAIGFVLRRHPVLSARYDVDTALPATVSDPPGILRTGTTSAAPDAIVETESWLWRQPFDLLAEPPVRAALWSFSAELHYLGLCVHHVAGDSWSLTVMLREIGEAYCALRQDRQPEATAAADFFAYAACEQAADPDLSWWRERLRGLPPLRYPRDIGPAEEEAALLHCFDLGLDSAATRGIRSLARTTPVSPSVVLLTAVSVATATTDTGDRSSLIGLPVALRDSEKLQQTVGPLLNTVPVRVSWPAGAEVSDLLRRHADAVDAAVAHKDAPLSWILRAAAVPRVPRTAGLFLHAVNVDTERPRLVLPGVRCTQVPVPLRWAQLPACWEFSWAAVGNVAGSLQVSADAFTTDQAGELVADFRSALAGLLAHR